MKKSVCRVYIVVAVLLAVVRVLDLFFCTSLTNGFVTKGETWMRYAAMAAFALALIVTPCDKTPQQPQELKLLPKKKRLDAALGVIALVTGIAAVVYAVQQLIYPTTMLGMAQLGDGLMLLAFAVRFVLCLGLLCFGAWQLMFYLYAGETVTPQKGTMRTLGFCSLAAFFALVIMRYAEKPASVYHVAAICAIFAALSALIYTGKLLGTLCVDFTPQYKAGFQKAAIFMFFMCMCTYLPNVVWEMAFGTATVLDRLMAIMLAVYSVDALQKTLQNAD